jgi:hypothetical protein
MGQGPNVVLPIQQLVPLYEWLLQETFDSFWKIHSAYEYAKDDPSLYTQHEPLLGLSEIFEQNRLATQLYIRRICYGNLPNPLQDELGNHITYTDGGNCRSPP